MPSRSTYTLPCDVGKANSIRRSLLLDLEVVAPSHVLIQKNTSSFTDEHIAQRIGLLFFPTATTDSVLSLSVFGRDATTDDFVQVEGSDSFLPSPLSRVCVARLLPDQELRLRVFFTLGTGRRHARFTKVVGVGLCPSKTESEDEEAHDLSFETLDDLRDGHDACVREALSHLRSRLRDAMRVVEEKR